MASRKRSNYAGESNDRIQLESLNVAVAATAAASSHQCMCQ